MTCSVTPGRRAFHLTEILIALAIAAGPLLIAINLVSSNAAGARFNVDRATARLVLLDLSELLMGEPRENLTRIRGLKGELRPLFDERIGKLPESVRKTYKDQVEELLPRIQAMFQPDVDPGARGLGRLTVFVDLPGPPATRVSIVSLFRPEARLLPREP